MFRPWSSEKLGLAIFFPVQCTFFYLAQLHDLRLKYISGILGSHSNIGKLDKTFCRKLTRFFFSKSFAEIFFEVIGVKMKLKISKTNLFD